MESKINCSYCNQSFNRKTTLKRHLREKHYTGSIYKCNMCRIDFVRKERLIRHLKSVHFNLKFECTICAKKFVENYKLNCHMKKVHNYNYCNKCKLSYNYSDNYHECITNKDIYYCSLGNCNNLNKYYNRLNFFIRHIQIDHNILDFNIINSLINNGKQNNNTKNLENISKYDLNKIKENYLIEQINILCIIENNKKKIICNKINSNNLLLDNISTAEKITLGKRGRPNIESIQIKKNYKDIINNANTTTENIKEIPTSSGNYN